MAKGRSSEVRDHVRRDLGVNANASVDHDEVRGHLAQRKTARDGVRGHLEALEHLGRRSSRGQHFLRSARGASSGGSREVGGNRRVRHHGGVGVQGKARMEDGVRVFGFRFGLGWGHHAFACADAAVCDLVGVRDIVLEMLEVRSSFRQQQHLAPHRVQDANQVVLRERTPLLSEP